MLSVLRFLFLLLMLVATVGGWLYLDYERFCATPLALPDKGVVYVVRTGTGVTTLARDLKDQGRIDNELWLMVLARQTDLAVRIQAGEYQIPAGATPEELLRLFASGRVIQHGLTLVEGWSFRQARAAIAASPVLVQTLAGLTDAEIMARLGHKDEHPEGRFLPDTYRFPRGTTDREFLSRAYRAMEGALAAEWAGRASGLPLTSPYEALTLASIVEKETGLAEERPRIAGVFVRRLQKGMRLQTDPTIIYGLGEAFDGNLRRVHLTEDGPYNSYTREGLVPTPICLPGRAALHAALHPADGNELYFVARGDGGHQFSASLDEHNRAVRRYQLR